MAAAAPGSFVTLGYAGAAGSGFKFEDVIGRGAFGLAFRVAEKLVRNAARRLAIMQAPDVKAEVDLRNEINWFKACLSVLSIPMCVNLRGAVHIVKVLADHDDTKSNTGAKVIRRCLSGRDIAPVETSSTRLTGPVVVSECLDNADELRLHYRLIKDNPVLPNRVLWAF
ncbi:hypothetical protein DL769_003243 [Monosporascus sp. CRB-8-3]|nr:hypothetical protein DL769_003243 [Monosporascus sp. CRB-8-3]